MQHGTDTVADHLRAQGGQDLYRQFERQRRTRLSYWFSLSNAAAFFLYFLINIFALLQGVQVATPGIVVSYVALLAFAGISLLAHWLSRRGYALAAAIGIIIPILIIITQFDFAWISVHGLDTRAYLALSSYLIIIPLASLLGNLTLMFITTVVVNVLLLFATLFLPIFMPMPAGMGSPGFSPIEQINNTATVMVLEWGLAFVMFFALNGYQRTLRELGDVRVQIERAKALDDLKDQFITNVNHELRNPVMAMQGYLDILEMSIEHAPGTEPFGEAKIRQLVTKAVQAGDSLRTLLSSILDARRLDQGASDFTPEVVFIRPIVDEAIAMIDPSEAKEVAQGLPARDLRLYIPPDAAIWGEKVRLQQILTNLLSNAIKYSEAGTPIELSVRHIQEVMQRSAHRREARPVQPTMLEISVHDHGHGIPPEQIPLLFQRFVRLPRDLASNVIGNGLGLFVCRALAEGMGGSIWVESAGVPGKGSTFILRLPIPAAEQLSVAPDLPAVADASSAREQFPVFS